MTLQFSSLYYTVLASNLRTSLVKKSLHNGFHCLHQYLQLKFFLNLLSWNALYLNYTGNSLKLKYLDLLQYIVIQQEIKDSDCYDTLFISIRFDIIFHDYNFFEKVI